MRSDIIRTYKDVHSWVGIVSGLALFIAFYAGAITMFEGPLQRWASPPVDPAYITPLDETPELIERVLAEFPEARGGYKIVLAVTPEHPASFSWLTRAPGQDSHDAPTTHYAALSDRGELLHKTNTQSEVANLVDELHQEVGLPFGHEVSMPVMGIISLLYAVALISGMFVLFPTLVKDLFAIRLGKNLKRMWLDLHNVLGLFSLPFHIVMALTAVVFAFHDQLYFVQQKIVYPEGQPPVLIAERPATAVKLSGQKALPASDILARIKEQEPALQILSLNYSLGRDKTFQVLVSAIDPAYGSTVPRQGRIGINPYSGDVIFTGYMPGKQDVWGATLSSFFALHFGSFGGDTVRWSYFFLGLAGAFLFYSGNLLWLETRRKKRRRGNDAVIEQSRSSHILGALTVAVPLGCVAGISLIIACAKLVPEFVVRQVPGGFDSIYYSVFVMAVAWALKCGAARSAPDLLLSAASMTVLIPFSSLLSLLVPGLAWNHGDASVLVDVVAFLGSGSLILIYKRTRRRIQSAPEESIWYQGVNA